MAIYTNKYLLEQTTERNNFKWAILGGHVLSGETNEDALKRELNLTNIKYEHIGKVKFPFNHHIFSVYKTNDLVEIDKLTYQQEEVITIKWFTKEEIQKMIEDNEIPRGYDFILKKNM